MFRAAVGAVCVAVALGGCGSDPEAQPLPPIVTVSPTPAAFPVPSEATPGTAQGAAAFARYYLKLLNAAFTAMDATAVRAVSDPGCGGCTNLIGAIEEPPEAGERVEGGEYEVVFAEAPSVEGGDVVVDIRYSLTEVRVYGPDGQLLRTKEPQVDLDAQMRLARRQGGWIVRGFRNVEQ